jgi:hypothetical protein
MKIDKRSAQAPDRVGIATEAKLSPPPPPKSDICVNMYKMNFLYRVFPGYLSNLLDSDKMEST